MLQREGHGLRVGQKAGIDREGDEGGSAFSTEHHEAGGAGRALPPMASTEHVPQKLSPGFG